VERQAVLNKESFSGGETMAGKAIRRGKHIMEQMTMDQVGVSSRAKITVLGIGGGGGNAINNMIRGGLEGVHFIAANTDWQVLERNLAPVKIQLGTNLTKGLGAGGQPEMGAKATQEDIEKIRESVNGSDMVFITAGLGGGTGTGGAPIIAQICKEMGALTVAVVTKPFVVEGKVRIRHADDGLKALQDTVDTLITIPNNRLLCLADKRSSFLEMIKRADDVLFFAVKGISDLIIKQGYINVDFNDVKTVMGEMGLALMGTGVASGENRASQAVQQAISSPLLEDISIHGARAALINISAGPDLGMHEFEEALSIIQKEVTEEANIILGMVIDEKMQDEIRVTVIATGIGRIEKQKTAEQSSVRPLRRLRAEGGVPAIDYDLLQIPPTVRQRIPMAEPMQGMESIEVESDQQQTPKRRTLLQMITGSGRGGREEEDLSIPTFIRRQAD
jgi:cell division protein FtsZ